MRYTDQLPISIRYGHADWDYDWPISDYIENVLVFRLVKASGYQLKVFVFKLD